MEQVHIEQTGLIHAAGLAPDVSGDAEMAVEQIHESPRQRRSFIFPCVRSPVWFPLLPA